MKNLEKYVTESDQKVHW